MKWQLERSTTMPPADHQVTLSPAPAATSARRPRSCCAGCAAELGFGYREVDVDAAPVLRDEYSDRVPVVLIDGKEHGYWRVEEPRFRTALAR